MPIKIKDAEGNEHEVFTQADLEAKIQETTAALRTELAEEFKPKETPATTVVEPKKEGEEMPEWAKELQTQIQSLGGTVTATVKEKYIGSVSSGLDADKKRDLEAKFESLSNYPETPEGQQQRAQDAYMLATGEKFGGENVNLNNINGGMQGQGGTGVVPAGNPAVDKEIQGAFGISAEDVAKFGPKQ